MRDAQSLLEQMLAFSVEDLTGEEVLDLLGIVDRQKCSQGRRRRSSRSHAQTCLEVVADLYRRGIDIKRFCQQLCDHFRNLLVLAIGGLERSRCADLPEEEILALEGSIR